MKTPIEIAAIMLEHMNDQPVVRTINSVLGFPDSPGMPKIYVVTTEKGENGACAILHRSVQDELVSIFGGSFLIIPSSIHEVLAIEDNDDFEAIDDMIRNVNQAEVSPDEWLGEAVVRYNADTKQFERR